MDDQDSLLTANDGLPHETVEGFFGIADEETVKIEVGLDRKVALMKSFRDGGMDTVANPFHILRGVTDMEARSIFDEIDEAGQGLLILQFSRVLALLGAAYLLNVILSRNRCDTLHGLGEDLFIVHDGEIDLHLPRGRPGLIWKGGQLASK